MLRAVLATSLVFLLLHFAVGVGVAQADDKSPALTYELQVPVRTRDGVTLAATVIRPAATGPKNRVPGLVVKTPYNRNIYQEWALAFARAGFGVALVDARGRGDSEGVFRPAEEDGRDGADAIEWIAAQPWCNGKVGTFGGSWDGFWQWAAMKERPPHLASAAPTAAVLPGIDFPMIGNVFYPYALRWLLYVSGHTNKNMLFGADELWKDWWYRTWRGEVSLRTLDELLGAGHEVYRKWLEHPAYDGFWQDKTPTSAEYARLDLPILTITGHYDDDQRGALTYYARHLASAPRAAAHHYLIVGPWDHGGTRYPATTIGGLEVGADSKLDVKQLHIDWFDWTLRKGQRPKFLTHSVMLWVTGEGAEGWRGYDSLSAATPTAMRYGLGSDGRADDLAHTGTLGATTASAASDVFVIDPADERRAELDPDNGSEVPVVNRRDAAPLPGMSLVYQSAPMPAPVELGGAPSLTVWLSMDVPDADLSARLYEVRGDGSTVFLASDIRRARYRESLSTEKLVEPGQVLRYDFTDFTMFARRLSKGSRLRLVFGPTLGYSWPNNRGSGKPVADERSGDGKVAKVTLVHDAGHPSELRIGLVAAAAKARATASPARKAHPIKK